VKGFVVALRRASNEDMIATIISAKNIQSYYRFYGARHSILQLGHLVDFEIQGEGSSFMPRLRSLSQTNFPWLRDRNRLLLWHNFIKLFEPHLRGTEDLERFYYDLLLSAAQKWHKQNCQRIICDSYISLLEYEGRLHPTERCYICESKLDSTIALMVSFKPAHPECIYTTSLDKSKVDIFFKTGKSTHLDDTDIEHLCSIILKGL